MYQHRALLDEYRGVWTERYKNLRLLLLDGLRMHLRHLLAVYNELVVGVLIYTTDLGAEGGLGLAKNISHQ